MSTHLGEAARGLEHRQLLILIGVRAGEDQQTLEIVSF
jgi:hypothetical protein